MGMKRNHVKDKHFDVIRGLYEAEGRPVEIEALDIALTIYLILRGALANPVRGSGSTFGIALNVTEPTIAAATERLSTAGWVQKQSGKSRRQANTYSVILENLPVAQELKRTVISQAAWELAELYMRAVPNNTKGRRRRFSKGERQRFSFALQTFLDRYTGGDAQLLRDVLNFALNHPKYAVKLKRGPHELRRPFRKILEEFNNRGTNATVPPVGVVKAEPAKPVEPIDPNAHPWDTPPLPSKTGQTVYKIQGWTVVGQDELLKLLNGPKSPLKKADGCRLFMRTPTQLTERNVDVFDMGGKWAMFDTATGKGIAEMEKAA
jgi:hypothetical protein